MTPRVVPAGGDAEDPGRYRDEIMSIDTPAYLWGYFQSERYFSAIVEQVVAQLALPSVTAAFGADGSSTVAVSFRRGDYVRLGWALPLDYYAEALALVADRVSSPHFVLFGDDRAFLEMAVDWVSDFGRASSAYDVVSDEVSQLALMSACHHSVIANSSFAWWGAWLGDRRTQSDGRIVVAPRWYRRWGDDIIPDRWVIAGDAAPVG
jgi:hypothetical protein